MQEKGMQQVWTIMPKGSQHGSPNRLKMLKMPEKRHAKIYTKNWCRKRVQKYPEMSYKGTKGGAPGGKEGKPPKAALRYLASLIWNAWHRPVSADFGLTFGAPLAPFGLILVAFWLKLGPFWCHVGPDFGYFAPSGCSFWLVVGEIKLLRRYFAKKYTCIDLASNFLQIFRMQIIFPRPGGRTIAAGNRNST